MKINTSEFNPNNRNFTLKYILKKDGVNSSYKNNIVYKLKNNDYENFNIPIDKLYNFLRAIIEGNKKESRQSNIFFELPTRGNYEIIDSNIDCELFLFPGKYKLTLIIEGYDEHDYSNTKLNLKLLNQNNFNSEINIKKIDNSFKKVGNPKKKIKYMVRSII